jgi:hypothetical protein
MWVINFFLFLLSFDCPKESNKEKATAYEIFGVITTELCPRASQAGRNDAEWCKRMLSAPAFGDA